MEAKIKNEKVNIYNSDKNEFVICQDDALITFDDIKKELPFIKLEITALSEKMIQISINDKKRKIKILEKEIEDFELAKKMDNWLNRKGVRCRLTSGLPF